MMAFFQKSIRTKRSKSYVTLAGKDNYTAFAADINEENETNEDSITWKVNCPDSICPLSRKDNFYVDSSAHGCVFVGYGLHKSKHLLHDVWCFNKSTEKWTKLQLNGDSISSRTGTRAAICGDYLICFGGFAKGKYLADTHIINVQTGCVRKLQTCGDEPTARTDPIVECYKNKLFVWGGFNNERSNELSVLDLSTLVWTQYEQHVNSRTSIPHIVNGSKLIAYGGSVLNNMLYIDMEKNEVYTEECYGQHPPTDTINSSFVRVGNNAYYLGGRVNNKSKNDVMYIYKYNVKSMEWTKFKTTCDKEIGALNEIESNAGTFNMKQQNSPTLFYDDLKRKLCMTLGSPERDPSYIFSMDISKI